MPIIPAKYIAQQEPNSMDCGFFVMMFMKHYNPDTHQLEFCDLMILGVRFSSTYSITT
jgi:hypothetical protein